jgi:dTDP-4-amino-4,6-dideoxygalactose transaminase
MNIPFLDLSEMHANLQDELDSVWKQISRSSKFITGEFVERFEHQWAEYCGASHCVGVASGTAALQLSLMALDIGSGDEVIVPTNTFFATVEAVLAVGAIPILIDVDPMTLLMTAAGVKNAITRKTVAVIAVHLYGQPVNMDSLREVTDAARLVLIEDASQAQGATWRAKRTGSLGHVGCFSFYPSKNLGAFGDAGAVVTSDRSLAERVRAISNHGRSRTEYYRHDRIGGNHRLDELQAAVLSIKLGRLDSWNADRRRVAEWYKKLFVSLPIEMVREADGACTNYHLAVIQTSGRDYLRKSLAAEGIQTSIHYPIPCHCQPALASLYSDQLPVAERAAGRILSLPMGPHITQDQAIRIVDAVQRGLERLAPIRNCEPRLQQAH